jgi:hypothetical protein
MILSELKEKQVSLKEENKKLRSLYARIVRVSLFCYSQRE